MELLKLLEVTGIKAFKALTPVAVSKCINVEFMKQKVSFISAVNGITVCGTLKTEYAHIPV